MKDHNAKIHRSRIEDIAVLGEELTEERLRLVSGGTSVKFPTLQQTNAMTCTGGGNNGCGTLKRDHGDTRYD